jgi:phage/plasmid-like protein (TIGR03299 family)
MPANVENMVSIRQTPWHGIGQVVPDYVSWSEGFALSGLDWKVRMDRIAHVLPDGGIAAELSNLGKVVVREDNGKALGIVGPNWRPLQNSEAFDWFSPFVEEQAVQLETAGSLDEGRTVWVLAKINGVGDAGVIDKDGKDTVQPYVLLSNSHDGSSAVRVGFTPIRIVCWNTLSQAHRSDASKLLSVKHTKRMKPTLVEVRDIMKLATQEFQATAAQYRKLAAMKINPKQLRKYVEVIVCTDPESMTAQEQNKVEQIVSLALNGKGNAGQEPSYWTAYNGYTQYLSWDAGRTASTRYQSLWFGKGAGDNKGALEIALEWAGATAV